MTTKIEGLQGITYPDNSVQASAAMTQISGDARYVMKTGGTMTGDLGVVSLNGGQLAGLRNKLINGGMQVKQRGTSGSAPINNYTYCFDRWAIGPTGVGVDWTNAGIGSPVNDGIGNVLVISGAAGNTGLEFLQRIEAANCLGLVGKSVTWSYWYYSPTNVVCDPKLYYANTPDNFATKTEVVGGAVEQIGVNGDWKQYKKTFTNLPAQVVNGLQVDFNVGAVGAGVVVGFNNVQLEEGSIATPFEQRPIGLELSLCQRYYEKGGWRAHGQATCNYMGSVLNFKQSKRATPVINIYSSSGNVAGQITVDAVNKAGSYAALIGSETEGVIIYLANQQTTVDQFATCNWTASAEL